MMSSNVDTLRQKLTAAWAQIDYYSGGSLRLGINHPLIWHVVYVTENSKGLVIVSDIPLNNLEPSKSILVNCSKRKNSYYTSFVLLQKEQESVFINMCVDLISYSSDALSEKDALNKVASRYIQWRRLMEKSKNDYLSAESRKGLLGELLFLDEQLESEREPRETIEGWVGPNGADQDFVYDDMWHEIKATAIASDKVMIHSLEQLGAVGQKGELLIYRIDPCAPEAPKATTLRKIVFAISQKLDDPSIIETFIEKLNMVGYIDLEIYDTFTYQVDRVERYSVDDAFPKITRESVPTAITECEYYLSIPAIQKWRRD